MSVSLLNEPIYILNACVPQREHFINVSIFRLTAVCFTREVHGMCDTIRSYLTSLPTKHMPIIFRTWIFNVIQMYSGKTSWHASLARSLTRGRLWARLDKFLIKIFGKNSHKRGNKWLKQLIICENESCNAPSRFYRLGNWKIIENISSHYISQAVSQREFPPYRKLRTALYCKYHSSDVDNFGCLNILDRHFFLKLKICPKFFCGCSKE